MNFYSVIIGTELLNGIRKDKHFDFLNKELIKRGWLHKASFIVEDDLILMENIFNLIKNDENSVMFSFGGIGLTPDDLTRQVAAKVFRHGKMDFHKEAKKLIENQFGTEAYPNRVNMSYLPTNSKLLYNTVNNVPGFYLDKRFFFTPGFPSMSQGMVLQALNTYYSKNSVVKYRLSLTTSCAESDLIELMNDIHKDVTLSSLPKIVNNKKQTVISVSGTNEQLVKNSFEKFITYFKINKIAYVLKDTTL